MKGKSDYLEGCSETELKRGVKNVDRNYWVQKGKKVRRSMQVTTSGVNQKNHSGKPQRKVLPKGRGTREMDQKRTREKWGSFGSKKHQRNPRGPQKHAFKPTKKKKVNPGEPPATRRFDSIEIRAPKDGKPNIWGLCEMQESQECTFPVKGEWECGDRD